MVTLSATVFREPTAKATLLRTIEIMARAARACTRYLPIIDFATELAAKAPRKDYFKQVQNIYSGFLRVWKYVREPEERITASPRAVWIMTLGKGKTGKGRGDCDDAAVAIAGLCMCCGFEARFVTCKPVNSPPGSKLPSHVFVEINVPGRGWLALDPVMEPHEDGFDNNPKMVMAWYFDMQGRCVGKREMRIP